MRQAIRVFVRGLGLALALLLIPSPSTQAAASTLTVDGRVVDRRGDGVRGAEVGLYEPAGERPRVWSGPEATEGTWRLRAEKDGFGSSERTVTLQGGAEMGSVVFVLAETDDDDS